jgi:chemotaxis protein CheZ
MATLTREEAYAKLGAITREMHEAFTVLGGSTDLHHIVEEFPNARDRLSHVGKMTENAANTVLNLVDAAKPECDELAKRGVELGQSLSRMAESDGLSVERARSLINVCGKFAGSTSDFALKQAGILSDIMMAQDFQDLSGQVIKKVIDIINRTELQLVQLLMDSAPIAEPSSTEKKAEFKGETQQLQGPQSNSSALAQGDVDNLLASLGF